MLVCIYLVKFGQGSAPFEGMMLLVELKQPPCVHDLFLKVWRIRSIPHACELAGLFAHTVRCVFHKLEAPNKQLRLHASGTNSSATIRRRSCEQLRVDHLNINTSQIEVPMGASQLKLAYFLKRNVRKATEKVN